MVFPALRHAFAGAGEIVMFDRSWYNRATVERVMGFCSDRQYWDFLRDAPNFERLLVNDGIILLKYRLSVDDDEQERRFQARAANPARRWKLSPIDIEGRNRFVQYSRAKDAMIEHTDIPMPLAPGQLQRQTAPPPERHPRHPGRDSYENVIPGAMKLPDVPLQEEYMSRPPRDTHYLVKDYYADMVRD